MSYLPKFVFALLILAAGLFAGCKSDQKSDTSLKDGEIVNTTMGKSGYRFHLPAGYELVDLKSDELKQRNVIQLYKQVLLKCKAVPYTGHYESSLISNGTTAIIFSMEFYQEGDIGSLEDANKRDKVMNEVLIRWRYDKEHNPAIENIDGKTVAHLTTVMENDFIDEQYVVLTKGDELFRFLTITPSNNASAAQAEVKEIITSLKY